MSIEQVNIHNFKCLKDIAVKLSKLTLITGVNSSGKSSFIQALLLLKQNRDNFETYISYHSLMEEAKLLNIEMNARIDEMIKKTSPFVTDGEFVTLGNVKNLLYQEAFEELIQIELTNSKEQSFKLNLDTNSCFNLKQVNAGGSSDDEMMISEILNNLDYIRTDRSTPSVTYPLSNKHIQNNSIGLNGEYATHYLAENRHKILAIEKLKHPGTTTCQLLENVSAWLGEISHGIDISVTMHEQLQMASLSYQYVYGEQTTGQYTPLNVGFGITYVLPIIVAILKSRAGDLLIIENPESHLHPAGQSKIAELCAIASSSGVQIIIETHSDHFLNGVRLAIKNGLLEPDESQIYYFKKQVDSLETIAHPLSIDKQGRIDEWPKGFFDEWDNKLNELLW
ncbi:MAG: DUF3696 domain-containing protein [gamma proteobacterium symbiont of Taylorina sp.]|nr:DUF3696 domain-containing protein [gamma proteobacterium symbiont of Taylorina sp.]